MHTYYMLWVVESSAYPDLIFELRPGFLKNLKIFFPPNFLQKRQFCHVAALND